jgi:predicted O-methyltransferase YrrM
MSNKLYFEHLKDFSSTEGYWSTTDCIIVAADILKKTSAKSMLEIGFNIGYSSAVWLEQGISAMYIIDINIHKDTEAALKATKEQYSNKNIVWLLADSTSAEVKDWVIPKIDLAFIDGGHTYDICLSDTMLSIDKGAKWLVYDDVIENHSNGIWQTITELETQNKIELICSYPMTWTGAGYVVLAKVL